MSKTGKQICNLCSQRNVIHKVAVIESFFSSVRGQIIRFDDTDHDIAADKDADDGV